MVMVNIEKRHLFIILALIIFLAGVILVIAANPTTKPNPGHYSNEIMVNILGVGDKTFQQAIDDGDFILDTPESTSCNQLFSTTPAEKSGWRDIAVPQECIGRPCKIVMVISKDIGAIDMMFGDYYQVTEESSADKSRWEIFGNVQNTQFVGTNGDTNMQNLMAKQNQVLADDKSGTDTDRNRWAYNDDSNTYGMTLKVCNY